MNYHEAVGRVRNLEPFTADELAELEAIPGVTIERGAVVRKGTVLKRVSWAAASYPDAITSPLDPPTVEGTNVTRDVGR